MRRAIGVSHMAAYCVIYQNIFMFIIRNRCRAAAGHAPVKLAEKMLPGSREKNRRVE